jgi:hypothetical protein
LQDFGSHGHAPPGGMKRSARSGTEMAVTDYNFTKLSHPLALNQNATSGIGINNLGQVVGSYLKPGSPVTIHGYVYNEGNYTTVTYTGSNDSGAVLINDGANIIGTYFNGDPINYSYYFYNGQTYTPIAHPGAAANGTEVNDINDFDIVVGNYGGQGFIYDGSRADGSKYGTLLNSEATGFYQNVSVNGINNSGDIVGTYTKSDYTSNGVQSTHAFIIEDGDWLQPGAWSFTTSYETGDFVTYGSSVFIALRDIAAGISPAFGLPNPTYWALLGTQDTWNYTGIVQTLVHDGWGIRQPSPSTIPTLSSAPM